MKRKNLLQRLGRKGGRRQIVITAEKSETFIIRQEPRGLVRAWCTPCSQQIECLTVEQALTLTGLSARRLFRLVEAEGIHFSETDDGRLFFCPNSIAPLTHVEASEIVEIKTRVAT